MDLKARIYAFTQLGELLSKDFYNQHQKEIVRASIKNNWFTVRNIKIALENWGKLLTDEMLISWLDPYKLNDSKDISNILVIMAGNIPLVGFHDFLCVLILNHNFFGKLSSKDSILFKYLVKNLLIIEPRFKSKIFFQSDILHSDLFICTGNDFSAKYFDFKLKFKPRIIRDSKASIAILDGQETKEYIKLLMKDVFLYYGLGCRSVSKLYIPRNYDFQFIKKYFLDYNYLLNHSFYFDNYRYNQSIYALKKEFFLDFKSILLIESKELFSPISVLYYEYYDELSDISFDFSKIQCVISKVNDNRFIFFGESQRPDLHDYADNIDTIDFLLKN